MSEIARSGRFRTWVRGAFLEFRLIPVLLWSYTAVALGTAVALAQGAPWDPAGLALAMALAALVQGWVTHSVNEIFDWRSGTDGDGAPRALSGGSKVRNLGLLTERGLWTVFALASLAVLALGTWVALVRAPWIGLLVAAGYLLGVAYTLPPAATAYRPFLGEWLGGFPGVVLAGLGAYGLQAGTLSWAALVAVAAHALVCCGMLIMHHYADIGSDRRADPVKRTTAVVLGSAGARRYATGLAGVAAFLYGTLAVLVHPAFWVGTGLTGLAVAAHLATNPEDLRSVTRHELQVIQLGIAAGLGTAVILAPVLWILLPLAAGGYAVHLVAVAPPAEFARAWH